MAVAGPFGPSTRRRGRPPKFGRPARPITLTLPLDVIEKLRAFHTDLSRAIVQLVQDSRPDEAGGPPVRLRELTPGQYLILVPYLETLVRVPGVRLLPVSKSEHLILIGRGRTRDLELSLRDTLEAGTVPPGEVSAVRDLVELLARYRRQLRIIDESFLVILGMEAE